MRLSIKINVEDDKMNTRMLQYKKPMILVLSLMLLTFNSYASDSYVMAKDDFFTDQDNHEYNLQYGLQYGWMTVINKLPHKVDLYFYPKSTNCKTAPGESSYGLGFGVQYENLQPFPYVYAHMNPQIVCKWADEASGNRLCSTRTPQLSIRLKISAVNNAVRSEGCFTQVDCSSGTTCTTKSNKPIEMPPF